MKVFEQFVVVILLLALASSALATEPLLDQLTIRDQRGPIFPEKCCWLGLPESKQLRSARLAERCSAIGGPVGQYKLERNRLWLVGLYACRGGIPLKAIYPALPNPALAEWLSGKFFAMVDWLCRSQSGVPVYRKELQLTVKRGIVVSSKEKLNDDGACAR
jgi:hypothetical protein